MWTFGDTFLNEELTTLDLLGDSESMSFLLTEAIGRADRLVNDHREPSALVFIGAIIWARDGHERDGMRDLWGWWVGQRLRCEDGLVVTVTTDEGDQKKSTEVREMKTNFLTWFLASRDLNLPGFTLSLSSTSTQRKGQSLLCLYTSLYNTVWFTINTMRLLAVTRQCFSFCSMYLSCNLQTQSCHQPLTSLA